MANYSAMVSEFKARGGGLSLPMESVTEWSICTIMSSDWVCLDTIALIRTLLYCPWSLLLVADT